MSDLLLEASGYILSSLRTEKSSMLITVDKEGNQLLLMLNNVVDYRLFKDNIEQVSISKIRLMTAVLVMV
jgi:hypothetical protein